MKAASPDTECAPRRRRRHWFRLAPVCLGLLLWAYPVGAQTIVAPEYNVKAGFLVKFALFTLWPEEVVSSNQPIVIGVLGDNPFGEVLRETAAKETGGRRIQVVNLNRVEEAGGCQVIFIGDREKKHEAEWLQALKDKPILTVGESGHTIERGGIIEFCLVRDRIRFDANWTAIQLAKLKISSPMLNAARKVYNAPSPNP